MSSDSLPSLILFTKPAIAGRVKTRLVGGRLSNADAARLHAAFLGDLLDGLAGGAFEVRPFWALEPGEPIPGSPPHGARQVGVDLGARLLAAFRAVAPQARLAVAIGSDHPELGRARIEAAFAALESGADLVLGPAEDGGYYLIGGRSAELSARLFEQIPWSTSAALEITIARASELALSIHLLPVEADVDTPADLVALAGRLRGRPGRCPRTARLLCELGVARS